MADKMAPSRPDGNVGTLGHDWRSDLRLAPKLQALLPEETGNDCSSGLLLLGTQIRMSPRRISLTCCFGKMLLSNETWKVRER